MVAIGEKYGRLTIVGQALPTKNRQRRWQCNCECGGIAIVRTDGLTSGRAQSCGCRQKEIATKFCVERSRHGMSRSRVYESWCHMIDRCTNRNNGRYADYGGRGVSVCDRWKEDFLNFYSDMGEMPDGMTLERKDNSKGYGPDNCHWATYSEQNRNRRNSIFIATEIGIMHLQEFCDMKNMKYYTAKRKFHNGSLAGYRASE